MPRREFDGNLTSDSGVLELERSVAWLASLGWRGGGANRVPSELPPCISHWWRAGAPSAVAAGGELRLRLPVVRTAARSPSAHRPGTLSIAQIVRPRTRRRCSTQRLPNCPEALEKFHIALLPTNGSISAPSHQCTLFLEWIYLASAWWTGGFSCLLEEMIPSCCSKRLLQSIPFFSREENKGRWN
jgi:hypothetical protein